METGNEKSSKALDILHPMTVTDIEVMHIIKVACKMEVAVVEFERKDLDSCLQMSRLILVNHNTAYLP